MTAFLGLKKTLSVSKASAPLAALLVMTLVASSCSGGSSSAPAPGERVSGGPTGSYIVPAGIHKIKHVIVIQQENRSFDSYFGTYPGADGIPMQNGKPTVCVNNPQTGPCEAPYVDHADVNGGGPHSAAECHGRHQRREDGRLHRPGPIGTEGLSDPTDPACTNSAAADVMGYHTRATSPTTGRTPRTSSSRTTCSSRTPRGVCRPTCSWCPSGRPTVPSRTIRRAV